MTAHRGGSAAKSNKTTGIQARIKICRKISPLNSRNDFPIACQQLTAAARNLNNNGL